MNRSWGRILLRICLLAIFTGCDGGIPFDESGVYLVGVGRNHVYYQYYKRDSGWEELPSALWSVDLATDASKRHQEPTRQSGLQAQGDFFVTEVMYDAGRKGLIVYGQVGTGLRRTIYERDLESSQYASGSFRIDGSTAVILTDEGLLVFDLVQGAVVRTLEVPDDTIELDAFRNNKALLGRGNLYDTLTAVLIDVATEEVVEIPSAPGNSQPYFFGSAIAEHSVVVVRDEELDRHTSRPQILLFDIPSRSWRVLTEYEAQDLNSLALPSFAFVSGADDVHVLVEFYRYDHATEVRRVELIDMETGDRSVIAESTGLTLFGPMSPQLHENQVFWVEPLSRMLVIYDIDSATREMIPIHAPRTFSRFELAPF